MKPQALADPIMKKNTDVQTMLEGAYEEVMWLARRPHTSPSAARAWYTHIAAGRFRRHICKFSGLVSRRALEPGAMLRLEHFNRLQTALTKLVARHLREGISDPGEFFRVVTECEQVHIVTFRENYEAAMANGDYRKAKIELVAWADIAPETQRVLWSKLRGRVCNAEAFRPKALQMQEGSTSRKRRSRQAAI